MDSVFITRLHIGTGPVRVAIKDLIDLEGTITTAGCLALARRSSAATHDAPLLAGIRAAIARGEVTVVGKTNLHELAFGADGTNVHYGTPLNPLDNKRIPGGSSSGSAVALATNEADVALGSDTGGSIRMPAACCAIVGLKTTHGRISVDGVWPLAPYLDTIGPMARDVAGVIHGMDLLEPGFAATVSTPRRLRIGRARPVTGVVPAVDAAIDAALEHVRSAGHEIVDVTLPRWDEVHEAGLVVLLGEAWRTDRHLLDDRDGVSEAIQKRLALGKSIGDRELDEARSVRPRGVADLRALFEHERLHAIALPTLPIPTPRGVDADNAPMTALTRYANLLGTPALSMPVPMPGDLPASMQLLGPNDSESMLCAVGSVIETVIRAATADR